MKHKRLAMIVAVILAALLILPFIIMGLTELLPAARAVTQKEINDRKTELAALRESRQQTQRQISSLRGVRDEVVQRKALYDEGIMMIEQDIELTMGLIADINAAIAEQQRQLDEARVREAELTELFIERVKAMERLGDISYLGILLGAESLTDFLASWDAVREIMSRDQKLADDLIAARVEIEEAIERMDEDRREQNEHRRELAETQTELAELSAEMDAMMAEYIIDMAKAQKELQDEEARISKAQKEIDEMEKTWARIQEEARRRNNPFVGGEYHWPVPGYVTISSGFGIRVHPIYKVRRQHDGIDIPAPRGTPVVAANAGQIIVRAYGSGYGNYIVVDHGGGQQSLYAHMHGFANAKVGDRVTRGQTIGYVGTTGLSTGNHLHFEIRRNGSPVDPDPLLRGR
ncbi:MAG: peptidoglycan DD-metalloendopeptidase family protein [Oscillospiraceae bacterium]|nr:peptidoglycan DD-metalloendopeptidase family protein [Oscillospiraceae bacterium]